jgi:hypothetical protein
MMGTTLFVGVSASGQVVSACGTIRRAATCTYLELDTGGAWYLGGPAAFEAGQHVRATGEMLGTCQSPCPGVTGCLGGAVISACTPTCRVDYDHSGGASLGDLFTFLEAFFSNRTGPAPPGADFDHSGVISVEDLFQFLAAWFAGCP